MGQLPKLESVRAELARRRLADFIRYGWHVVEPGTPLIWNWHIDAICLHLEAVTRGDIKRLLINIPPGHMKSLIVSVFWPAWEWIHEPTVRNMFSSYAMELATRDSIRCRDLLTSDWYTAWFPHDWRLKADENNKGYFANTRNGFRFSLSVGGRATGFRGNKVVCDDPLNAKDQFSAPAREEAIFWWDNSMSSRLNDMRKGARVIIMQRLHEEDLSGHNIAKKRGYEHLCLPSEWEPRATACPCETCQKGETSIGWRDPRTERDAMLFPELFPREVLAEAKTDLGSVGYAGQHQQRPSPAEGSIFKAHWWKYWCYPGQELPPVQVRLKDNTFVEIPAVPLPDNFDEVLQSWDMTFKDTKNSDDVCGQVWGRHGANKFLLHQVCERMNFTKSCNAVVEVTGAWPSAHRKLVEDKANGPAVIDALTSQIPGLVAVNPEGGKEARANAVSAQVESGNVYLPHPLIFSWVEAFRAQTTGFPGLTRDDMVDAMTQALIRWLHKRKKFGVA